MMSLEINKNEIDVLYRKGEPTFFPHRLIDRLKDADQYELADRLENAAKSCVCSECGRRDVICSLSTTEKKIFYGCQHCLGRAISKKWSGD